MGLGQTMLTVGFLVLLTIAVINANKLIVDKDESYYKAEAYKQASLLANSLITEIQTKKFDSQYNASYTGMQPTSQFDPPSAMGPGTTASNYVNPGGAADTYPYKSVRGDNPTYYFDDVDDYNGYIRSANTSTLTGFTLTVSVYYVYPSNTDLKSNWSAQYTKRIDVTVSNSKYLDKDLVFSAIAYYDY